MGSDYNKRTRVLCSATLLIYIEKEIINVQVVSVGMGIIEDITSFAYDILPMNMKLKKNGNCRIDKDTDVADKGNYIGVSEKTAR